tara:strand:- start:80 stop:295 length:216 start_codon:yes stop_codon:yes gene_type:complete
MIEVGQGWEDSHGFIHEVLYVGQNVLTIMVLHRILYKNISDSGMGFWEMTPVNEFIEDYALKYDKNGEPLK